MKTFLTLLILLISLLFLWDTPGEVFRKEVANGYRERCLKAQAQPGREQETEALCGCEAMAVEETFSAPALIMAIINKQLGKPALEEKEMKEVEEKVRICFQKAAPGLSLSRL